MQQKPHIGARMKQVCAILNEHGILDVGDIHEHMADADYSALHETVKKLVKCGLVTCVGGAGKRANPWRYKVVQNWKQQIETRNFVVAPIQPVSNTATFQRAGVNCTVHHFMK